MTKKNLLNIPEPILLQNGFTKDTLFDRDEMDKDFTSKKVETFTKKINDELSVEVVFGYRSNDEGKTYTLFESGVELRINNEWSAIQIDKLSVLLTLLLILEGYE